MNIFILDNDPAKTAHYMIDKHVVKMPVEYAQILSTVCRGAGLDVGYKPTHVNHPCTKWARASQANYSYLYHLAQITGAEYTARYGKLHKATLLLSDLPILLPLEKGPMTPFAQAMPEEYRNPDPVAAYRAYYRAEKAKIATWKHGQVPEWW